MNTVFLGLGTNIGNRAQNIKNALNALRQNGLDICAESNIYESPAWGYTDQPDFLNSCVKLETNYSANKLLVLIKSIEKDLGREETFRWGPRLIDIDILYFNNQIINSPDLTVPHPGIPLRDFILSPLNEIAPDFIHPINGKTTESLLKELAKISSKIYNPQI